MAPFRRRAPVRGAATQGVARAFAPATSRGSAPSGSRRSTEPSGFTVSETDFGSLAPSSASAVPAPAAPVSASPGPASPASAATALSATPTKDLFRQYMQAYLEDCRDPALAPAPAHLPADAREETSDRPLKAKNPDLYYGNSQMESDYFCQQCEEPFDTDWAKGHKRVSFAAFFLKDRILYRW